LFMVIQNKLIKDNFRWYNWGKKLTCIFICYLNFRF
jgi:hypothetical protein